MPNFISEEQIEQALLQRLQHVCGFDVLECHTTDPADLNDGSGRLDKRDVLLPARLKAAALQLNPRIPEPVVDAALAHLADRRQAMSLIAANREVDGLLRDGIAVSFDDAQGRPQHEQLRLIDFNAAHTNEFLAVTQLWVKCTGNAALATYRRPDVLLYLRGVTEALIHKQDIEKVVQRIAELLDESVVVDKAETFKAKDFEAQYQIIKRGKLWDLSKIDFDKLRQDFGAATYKNIEIADLRQFITHKLELMLAQNSTRGNFAQRFQKIIDAYNAGSTSTEQYFDDLVKFTANLKAEDERAAREGLNEGELEIFDLLCKESMTEMETQKVKLAAKALLHRLQDEPPRVLVQDWYKTDQTRRIVRSAVAEVLGRELPQESYDRALFQTKCDNVFHLVLDCAAQGRKWAV